MAGLGWQELLIIFGILLLLFGATRLPGLAKGLGQSIRGFKKGLEEDELPEAAADDEGQKAVGDAAQSSAG